jgi:hypothetical protein
MMKFLLALSVLVAVIVGVATANTIRRIDHNEEGMTASMPHDHD